MLQMSLGVVSRERFSCVELVKEYIRAKQMDEVRFLLLLLLLIRMPRVIISYTHCGRTHQTANSTFTKGQLDFDK